MVLLCQHLEGCVGGDLLKLQVIGSVLGQGCILLDGIAQIVNG
jgi:hypothetical protein